MQCLHTFYSQSVYITFNRILILHRDRCIDCHLCINMWDRETFFCLIRDSSLQAFLLLCMCVCLSVFPLSVCLGLSLSLFYVLSLSLKTGKVLFWNCLKSTCGQTWWKKDTLLATNIKWKDWRASKLTGQTSERHHLSAFVTRNDLYANIKSKQFRQQTHWHHWWIYRFSWPNSLILRYTESLSNLLDSP